MQYEVTELYTGLPVILSPAPETPRMALAVAIRGGISREPRSGVAEMANRLLLKGTTTRSAEALARELDERAIDLRELNLTDSTVLLAVFLNRELPVVLELLEDILFHSTFADFPKEADKLAGDIRSSLDMPAEQAQDLLVRSLFPNHPYGHTGTQTLKTLAEMSEAEVRDWYYAGLNPRQMGVTLVGDFDPDKVLPLCDDAFADLVERGPEPQASPIPFLTQDRLVTEARPDAQQAQVIQGWYAPALGAEEHAPLAVMNTILGGSGLSSRLFVELRSNQGLAYSVHSQYLPMRQVGEFVVAMGTSPENIAKARTGFAEQIARIQQDPITLDELQHAKGRLQGNYVLAHETNSQICLDMAIQSINGVGPDYNRRLLERVAGVTTDDVQAVAQRIAAPSVTAIVAREDALPTE